MFRLATHAIVKQIYNIDRIPLSQKRWGVYSHNDYSARPPNNAQH